MNNEEDRNEQKKQILEILRLGEMCLWRKEYELAETQFRRMIELDPGSPLGHNKLGIIYAEQGMFDQARRKFEQAIEMDPEFARAYNNLGNICKEEENYEEAIKCYNKAIQLEPNYPTPHNNLAVIYRKQKKFGQAVDEMKKANKLLASPSWKRNPKGLGIAKRFGCFILPTLAITILILLLI
jgi:Flp pilus assembly protein TadD